MSRTLPAGYAALTEAQIFRPVILVEINWPDGYVRMWNGYGSIQWGGNTYTGAGKLGSMSGITESKDGRANGMSMTITGIPSDLLAEAVRVDTQGRAAKVWLAGMTDVGTFAADPYLIFDGVVDQCPIDDNGVDGSITVTLEKELFDRRGKERRYNHEDQQIDSPGDNFFMFVAGLPNVNFDWGKKTVSGTTDTPAGAADSGGYSKHNNQDQSSRWSPSDY